MNRGPGDPSLAAWWRANPIPGLLRHADTRGTGIRVAMLDTGVDLPLLASRHPGSVILQEPTPSTVPAAHGTLVADILLKLAPSIELTVIDLFAGRGTTNPERLIHYLETQIDSPTTEIVNCSLGWPEERWDTPVGRDVRQKINRLVEHAYEQGICVVAAAHNDHPLARSCPADRAPPLIGVTAGNWDNSFRIDFHPGNWVEFSARSTAYMGVLGRQPASSWAAPHVSALVARLLGLWPGLRPFEIKAHLAKLHENCQYADSIPNST
jgi:hypothetical protein